MLDRIRISWLVALLAFVFLLAPFIVVVGASFDGRTSYFAQFPPQQLTLDWYTRIPPAYWRALLTSFLVACTVSVLATLIGLTASLGIVRSGIAGTQALQAFFRLPLQIPLVVSGAVFLEFYFKVAAVLGIELLYTFRGLVIAHLFVAIPYSVGAISSVLVRFDTRLEEAAYSLGASGWSAFRRVTLPAVRSGLVISIFYSFIVSFGDVPISLFLVNNEISTLPVRLFYDMQFDFHPTVMAISSLILGFSFVLVLTVQRASGMNLAAASGK
ncbi:MAG: ABC transporter permease [Burkholderiaceae bacterium]